MAGLPVTSACTTILPDPDATMNDAWPGVWPGVGIAMMPGATSLPVSYFVTLSAIEPKMRRTFSKVLRTGPLAGARLMLPSSIQNAHSAAGTMISALG
jgi:hypothetical protein